MSERKKSKSTSFPSKRGSHSDSVQYKTLKGFAVCGVGNVFQRSKNEDFTGKIKQLFSISNATELMQQLDHMIEICEREKNTKSKKNDKAVICAHRPCDDYFMDDRYWDHLASTSDLM